MDEKTLVIGIDHGWSQMKTANAGVFTTGVKEITTEPALYENILEYENHYYKVGGTRLEVKDTKVTDDNFYLLTLAAIAKELEYRCKRSAHVLLAVGLPIGRFGAEKKDFINYLKKNKEVCFKYEKKEYRVVIEKVAVYPQGYGAIVKQMSGFSQKELVVDVGSWTVDLLPIVNHSPDESLCVTTPDGIITCMRRINEQCIRQLNGEVDEYIIQEFMMTGTAKIDDTYIKIMRKEIETYVERIIRMIGEQGYNLKTIPVTFVGGGAGIVKRFGNLSQKNITYLDDVKANAKGYEYLGRLYLEQLKKRRLA
jgi:plasmid segregation protein ParM